MSVFCRCHIELMLEDTRKSIIQLSLVFMIIILYENKMSEISDATIRVPETETYKVQELHLPIYHYLCEKNEEYFYSVYKNGNYYNTHMYLPLDKSDFNSIIIM